MTTAKSVNGHRVTDADDVPRQRPDSAETSGNEYQEVAKLAMEQDKNHQLQQIQRDPVFGTVLSRPEMDAERKVDEEIHTAERKYRRKSGLARAKHQHKVEGQNDKEARDLTAARRKRRTFTDGAAALVSAYRAFRLSRRY